MDKLGKKPKEKYCWSCKYDFGGLGACSRGMKAKSIDECWRWDKDIHQKMNNPKCRKKEERKIMKKELTSLLNRKESSSNTPDYILCSAEYLLRCLDNWDRTMERCQEHAAGLLPRSKKVSLGSKR